jgi:hypothetical protein
LQSEKLEYPVAVFEREIGSVGEEEKRWREFARFMQRSTFRQYIPTGESMRDRFDALSKKTEQAP